MIIKAKILVEALVLEPGIDDLGLPDFFPSVTTLLRGLRKTLPVLLNPLVIFPGP